MSKILLEAEHLGLEPKKKTAKEYCSPCPFCGGIDRFILFVKEERYWCRQCNKYGDVIQLVRETKGLSFEEACKELGYEDKLFKRDIYSRKLRKRVTATIVDTYDYVDEDGELLYQVVRFYPKNFSQRRPDGKGGWIPAIGDTRRVLYRLPKIVKAKYCFFVEGEKDVHTLEKLGFTATTNPMGANKIGSQHEKYNILEPLFGKKIYIIPDNDNVGKQHAEEIASILYGKTEKLKIVHIPYRLEQKDITDFVNGLSNEDAIEEIKRLVKNSPDWRPRSTYITIKEILALPSNNHLPIIGSGIMPYNSHIIIAGESGVGKSIFRSELALHLASGRDWLGFSVPQPQKVAILQFENSEYDERDRLKLMMEDLGIKPDDIGDNLVFIDRSTRPNLNTKQGRDKLFRILSKSGASVFIYDCLSNIHNTNENDNVKIREVLDYLSDFNAQLKSSCIIVHHFGKPSEMNNDPRWRIRGASSIIDWAYTVMTYRAKPHKEKELRLLDFVKVRVAKKPHGLLLERTNNLTHRIIQDSTLCPPGRVRDILKLLGGYVDKQKKLVSAIMKEVGCSERSAKSYIKLAVERGMIKTGLNQKKKQRWYSAER